MSYLICFIYMIVICHWVYVVNKQARKFAEKYSRWLKAKQ